jgi:methylthioribose-1-phosphate isomerase
MSTTGSSLQSLIYTAGDDDDTRPPTLKVLDQLLLPQEKKYIDVPNAQAAWAVIRSMQIRGMFGRSTRSGGFGCLDIYLTSFFLMCHLSSLLYFKMF